MIESTEAEQPLVVVKVGGSLLGWPEFPQRLRAFLAARPGERLVLIVGGGQVADIIRAFDNTYQLGDETSHHLALRTLDLTAHVLAALLPGLAVVDDVQELGAIWDQDQVPILAPRRFLDEDDARPDALPHTWDSTTDSIAARIAVCLRAAELVLLKSAPLPIGCDRTTAARLGLVDAMFPEVSCEIVHVSYINLRYADNVGQPLVS